MHHTDRFLAAALALLAAAMPAPASEREASFDRTLIVSGPVELDAATHSGRIAVRAGEGGEVRIHGVIRHSGGGTRGVEEAMREIESNPPIRQDGNVIRIEPVEPETARRRLSVSYEITVPKETRLRARTGSGGIAVAGLAGPVRAHTGSGRIELVSIQGAVDAHTGSGSIDGAGIAGPVVARTGSGAIRIEQTAHAALTARTGSGGVTVRLPQEGGFDLRGQTGSGGIHVEHPVTVRGSIGGRTLAATMRGGGPLVDISTGSGAIRIE